MTNKVSTRILTFILVFAMLCLVVCGLNLPINTLKASAAATSYKFDLGENATNGYTSVSATQGYDASVGYGFRNTAGVKDVAASGSGALSDAVQFTDTENANNTFDVDLENGLYNITVALGNTNRTSVYIEGMLQIVNMTGNNAVHTLTLPITDGQLNIRAAAGKAGYAFSISALEINRISADTTLPPTVWMCGDSTVCNYYPLETSVQAGWGQILPQYIPEGWQVRNMAASGQYAKGFVDAGQFDAIEYYGKKGDIYIISIGINDTNYSNAEEYTATVTDMVTRAKAKGMTVILVKQQGRASDVNRNPLLGGRWFGGQLDEIGAAQNVQVIDLFTLWQNHTTSIGYDATLGLYCDGDDLHPNRQGAIKLAELASSQIDWNNSGVDVPSEVEGAVMDTEKAYRFKNKNSGMYMEVEGGESTDGTNVSQQSGKEVLAANVWNLKAAENGYYYILSNVGDGSKLLDLENGAADNGTNIGIWGDTAADAQLFKFVANEDGSYVIRTKSSGDKSAIEVKDALTTEGGNVQQWELNSHNCQSWYVEPVKFSGVADDEVILGDLNGNGIVNVCDQILLRRHTKSGDFNKGFKRQYADTNSDGVVDSKDCSAMNEFLTKKGEFEAFEKKSGFYYANETSFSQGVTENTNAGFKKDSYVNLDNKLGSFLEWSVSAPENGNYLCTFKIANGTDTNRKMEIYVNGGKDYWLNDFLTTGAWTEWSERGIVLPLVKGKNVIRMVSNTENGGPNIDSLYIEKTEEPIAEIYVPEVNPDPQPDDNTNPTVFIAGDSTVQTYRASYAPQQGWGAYLQDYLPDNYTVSNKAIAGRSSKSFYDNGRLDTILNEMKEGDYLLVQFGINDSASSNAERYAPVSESVPGTDGSFEYYIAKYIEGAKEKGGNPILVTTVLGLKAYNQSTGQFEGSYTNYCNAMKSLASYYNIPCVDLNSLMVDHYNSIGYDAAYYYHLISTELSDTDMTHFTETGATEVAKLVADELKKQNIIG